MIYRAEEIGGGRKISGDDAVVFLGLQVLFVRAAVSREPSC